MKARDRSVSEVDDPGGAHPDLSAAGPSPRREAAKCEQPVSAVVHLLDLAVDERHVERCTFAIAARGNRHRVGDARHRREAHVFVAEEILVLVNRLGAETAAGAWQYRIVERTQGSEGLSGAEAQT